MQICDARRAPAAYVQERVPIRRAVVLQETREALHARDTGTSDKLHITL
jgi:hypothetical protein